MNKERIIQEFVPGKQVTLAHLIAHPGEELAKKIGVPDAGAIGIMTLTPGETAMIAGDLWHRRRSRRSAITDGQRAGAIIKLYPV